MEAKFKLMLEASELDKIALEIENLEAQLDGKAYKDGQKLLDKTFPKTDEKDISVLVKTLNLQDARALLKTFKNL